MRSLKTLSGFADRGVAREVKRALELQQTDQTAANEVWSRVDRMIVEPSALVPLLSPRAVTLVSARVGNYQYHAQWHVLLDQLWVR